MDAWMHCWCLHFGQIYQFNFNVFPVYAWPSRKRTERRIDLIAIQLGQQEIYPLNFNHRLAGHQNRTTNIQTLLRNFAEDTRKGEGRRIVWGSEIPDTRLNFATSALLNNRTHQFWLRTQHKRWYWRGSNAHVHATSGRIWTVLFWGMTQSVLHGCNEIFDLNLYCQFQYKDTPV